MELLKYKNVKVGELFLLNEKDFKFSLFDTNFLPGKKKDNYRN